ncbi:hypothetical protein WR25_27168 isoform A [Diploscapter pachys]|uniref:Uncharacterized protein n=1 Tax=Diploscapter pachys TaxID=2018661 RepID=A0A2A2LWZ4_9BILA|nr:hypothetical protein WR25_27168 isoform A [Diploscapter pachys]
MSRNTSQGSSGRGNRLFSSSEEKSSSRELITCPLPDPPIDYTVRFKPPPQRARTSNVWDTSLSEPSPSPEKPPELIPRLSKRRDTIGQSEMILDDLDRVLDEDQRPKLPKQKSAVVYDEPTTSFTDDIPIRPPRSQERRSGGIQRSKSAVGYPKQPSDEFISVSSQKQQSPVATIQKVSVPPPILPVEPKNVPPDFAYSSYEISSSQRIKQESSLYAMYLQVQKFIDDSRELYSPSYFRRQYMSSGIPSWKAEILSNRRARETMEKIEEDAWADFETWRLDNTPSVQINSKYYHAAT